MKSLMLSAILLWSSLLLAADQPDILVLLTGKDEDIQKIVERMQIPDDSRYDRELEFRASNGEYDLKRFRAFKKALKKVPLETKDEKGKTLLEIATQGAIDNRAVGREKERRFQLRALSELLWEGASPDRDSAVNLAVESVDYGVYILFYDFGADITRVSAKTIQSNLDKALAEIKAGRAKNLGDAFEISILYGVAKKKPRYWMELADDLATSEDVQKRDGALRVEREASDFGSWTPRLDDAKPTIYFTLCGIHYKVEYSSREKCLETYLRNRDAVHNAKSEDTKMTLDF